MARALRYDHLIWSYPHKVVGFTTYIFNLSITKSLRIWAYMFAHLKITETIMIFKSDNATLERDFNPTIDNLLLI